MAQQGMDHGLQQPQADVGLGMPALHVTGGRRRDSNVVVRIPKLKATRSELALGVPVGRLEVHSIDIAGSRSGRDCAGDGGGLAIEFLRRCEGAAVQRRLQFVADDE